MINTIQINGTAFPFPTKISLDYETNETVNTTEAGTDSVILTRANKMTLSTEFQLSSMKYATLKGYADLLSVTVTLTEAGTVTTKTMRIRDLKADYVDNSRYTEGTAGLWRVSCKFIEF